MSDSALTTTGPVDEALAAAGIPIARVGRSRAAGLTPAERQFYFWILRRFVGDGRPTSVETAAEARRLNLDLEQLRAKLVAEDLVHVDADGEVVVAYPFSGRPTPHRVTVNGRTVHAMCAIDALGIAPMFGEAIAISSAEPISGERVDVQLAADGTANWQPEKAVVVAGRCCDGAAFQGCCQVLNFFASPASAEQYLHERDDVRGHVISLPEAIEVGRYVFGDVFSVI